VQTSNLKLNKRTALWKKPLIIEKEFLLPFPKMKINDHGEKYFAPKKLGT